METKVSKIKKCEFKSEYTGQHGTVYYHNLEMENGDKGQIGVKEKNSPKIAVGVELNYTITKEEKNGYTSYKIKAVNPNGGGSFKRGTGSNASFALAYAKDVVVGSWVPDCPNKLTSKDLFKIAEEMYNWMEKHK